MTAAEACDAIRIGLETISAGHEIRCVPIADGGDGMARAITIARSGEWQEIKVSDPFGKSISAGFGLIERGETAVIEMAEASGLWRVDGCGRDPYSASTFGTGELICFASELGVKQIILGIGGSATNDGGAGMALALGYRFLDARGCELDRIPDQLTDAKAIVSDGKRKIPSVTVACDVTNPLLGESGCTEVYGPQKGIVEADMVRHEQRLEHFVSLLGEEGRIAAKREGSGAAGGLGFGCLVFLEAALTPGFELVADVLNLDEHVRWADHVITGEGKLDSQSLHGKAPVGVAEIARRQGKATTAFCGLRGEGDFSDYFDRVIELNRGKRSVGQSMKDGIELLKATVSQSF